ncbi:MAG: hypothetical protein NT145_07725 [Elusimicrobia bacterium]|nr:hypothetical protein [Elusimicrobiota bacterium]
MNGVNAPVWNCLGGRGINEVSTALQTLTLFVKGLRSSSTGSLRRKGLEKSLWAKKFIQGISYSKQNIIVELRMFEPQAPSIMRNPQSGINLKSFSPESPSQSSQIQSCENKKEESIKPSSFLNAEFETLRLAPQSVSFRTVDIILPNMIHGCKRKDI